MLTKKRFALNRIIAPAMGLSDFVKFTAGLGISKIEIRNDLFLRYRVLRAIMRLSAKRFFVSIICHSFF